MQSSTSCQKMGIIPILIFLIFSAETSVAQQHQKAPLIAQFMHNQLIYNPASAGMQETQFNANLLSRIQWNEIQGSPLSNFFLADYKFAANRVALGVYAANDQLGAHSTTDLYGNFAYRLPITRKLNLSMGLRFGTSFYRFDTDKLTNIWHDNDPLVLNATRSTTLPKAGTGFQLQSKNMYIGIAIPDLIISDKDNIYSNSEKRLFEKSRNYIAMAGYRYKLNDSYSLFPNIRFSYFPGSENGYRADFNLIAEITDYFWAGATYSTTRNFAFMAGTHISSRIRFGYAFEFMPELRFSNTHELNLMINMDNLVRRER